MLVTHRVSATSSATIVPRGIDVDDTLYLPGLIYNDGMHIHDNVDDSSPAVSRLLNMTVRHMPMESIKAQVSP
jgi:hypothetical protein